MQKLKDKQLVTAKQDLVQLRHDLACANSELAIASEQQAEALESLRTVADQQLHDLQAAYEAINALLKSTRLSLVPSSIS
jgi:hypothetical protein